MILNALRHAELPDGTLDPEEIAVRVEEKLFTAPNIRIPNIRVSRNIIKFYIEHRSVLIENTSSRCLKTNADRNHLFEVLSNEIKAEFGITPSKKEIKNHFTHVKRKIFEKASKQREREAKERRHRLRTGWGIDRRLEERFAASPPALFKLRTG
ncbi:hypothetical protein Y032_0041g399 [Ancylostoma ceylanicum]|uniref:Uncharacterized protein n=1 Tax=Ancylostoma ceylanicum TaxID=53326 RepID=A0A016UGB5_9BILA|nr:hypothetical protein Y032_0041g399 [Ancylostoma ceylanicum]